VAPWEERALGLRALLEGVEASRRVSRPFGRTSRFLGRYY